MLAERSQIEPILLTGSFVLGSVFLLVSFIPVFGYFFQIGAAFGFIYLSYGRRIVLMTLSALAAVVAGILVYGYSMLLVGNWSLVVIPAVLIGTLAGRGFTPAKAYFISALVAIGISLVIFFGIRELMYNEIDNMKGSVEVLIGNTGLSATAANDIIDQFNRLFMFIKRLLPSMLILSSMLQLFIGWLLVYMIYTSMSIFMPSMGTFVLWKMPNNFIYITGVAVLARLIGPESIKMIADNILFCIGFFYAVFGFSLVEYYLKKLGLSLFMKIVVYLAILLLQVPGLIIAAVVGFIDSYFDFRKVRARIIG